VSELPAEDHVGRPASVTPWYRVQRNESAPHPRLTGPPGSRGEQEQLQRGIYRQTLRLEEHDDPNHPVIAAATRRIEELSSRYTAVEDALKAIKRKHPRVLTLTRYLHCSTPSPTYDQSSRAPSPTNSPISTRRSNGAIYNKPNNSLEISAVVRPDLIAKNEMPTDETGGRSGYSYIAGAGFEPATFGL
jgi:hypothetical protein